MHLNETSQFLLLTLAIFCLTLGAVLLLFSVIEWIFFALGFIGIFLWISSIAIGLGALFLFVYRRMST